MIDKEDYHQAAVVMLRNAIGADNVDIDMSAVEIDDAQGGAWVLVPVFVSDEQALEASKSTS